MAGIRCGIKFILSIIGVGSIILIMKLSAIIPETVDA